MNRLLPPLGLARQTGDRLRDFGFVREGRNDVPVERAEHTYLSLEDPLSDGNVAGKARDPMRHSEECTYVLHKDPIRIRLLDKLELPVNEAADRKLLN